MEVSLLTEWNPWWEDPALIKELAGRPRPAYDLLTDSVGIREVTVITGVRRSGKSTLMYQMIEHLLRKKVQPKQLLFVNLEDKKLAAFSLDDIYLAYREQLNPDEHAYIFLDEIQKKSDWESWVRKKYDLKTKDKFVVSGSSSFLLKKEYSTLLTGRNLTFEVFPLSFKEFLLFQGVQASSESLKKGVLLEKTIVKIQRALREYLALGGFPEVLFKPERYKQLILAQYFDDIIYKDIVDRHNLSAQKVRDLALFFLTNATCLVSLRSIRNSLALSYDTTKDYLSYYKEAFLLFLLEHFSYSLKEQKTLPSKIYCIDNGLRNAVSFTFSKDEGKLAENAVCVELKRRGSDVYYWKNHREVDFIVKNNDRSLSAINVTFTDEVHEREVEGLAEFRRRFGKTKELLVLTKSVEKKEGGVVFLPLWKWLLLS